MGPGSVVGVRPLAAVLATALALALVTIQPFAGRRRYRRLLAALAVDPDARLRHYRRGITGEWAIVGVIAVIGVLAGRSAASVGLTAGHHVRAATAEVAEVAALLALSAVLFRAPALRDAIRRQARGFAALLPRTTAERAAFAALALTAGVCEEVMFRGFGIAYVRWLWPGATHTGLTAVTAVAFGIAHVYQGPRGVLLTGLIGALLASVVLSTGSLFPAMAIHALVDLRVLALPPLDPPLLDPPAVPPPRRDPPLPDPPAVPPPRPDPPAVDPPPVDDGGP
jgi:membrane protease YdiL (CAAX protease family)